MKDAYTFFGADEEIDEQTRRMWKSYGEIKLR